MLVEFGMVESELLTKRHKQREHRKPHTDVEHPQISVDKDAGLKAAVLIYLVLILFQKQSSRSLNFMYSSTHH
jgi:hypothetical protein